jgi:hypothetical protein
LDDAEIKGFSHVVSWLEGGTMFKVHKPKEFADRVMPCYFNQTRYKSFQRQLNSYRFSRFVAGKNKGTCFHELFTRDKPDLCRHITRVKVTRGRLDRAQEQQQKAHAFCDQEVSNTLFLRQLDDGESWGGMTISDYCGSIHPLIASEIVNIFGSHAGRGGDSLFHTRCT